MLQLKNNTPFAAAFALFPNEQGIDTLYTMVQGSFLIGPQWTLLEKQIEPQKEDVYWGEPGKSSLRFASDYHTGKSATDVIMIGSACARDQQPTRRVDVSLQVGSVSKNIIVFGDRRWERDRISHPEVFTTMPLVYERAFGGSYFVNGKVVTNEERNPVGLGFVGESNESEIYGTHLPNLECPRQLIQHFHDAPMPACFAPVAPNWLPRRSYAGTYDEEWQTHRAPYLPEDYDSKFMNSAHPDLIYPGFLAGGEPVKIIGMHPAGELNFNLPHVSLINKISVADKEVALKFLLEKVVFDPNQLCLSMVWRSAFECNKKALKISQISVSMTR